MSKEKTYIAIDLKSFYASVECVERKLNPLDTYLVVADKSRTDKTICLAVTPALKNLGISSRPRLFEVIEDVKNINLERENYLKALFNDIDITKRRGAISDKFIKSTVIDSELQSHPEYKLDYVVAPPQMAKYVEVSTQIFGIYLDFVSAEDVHVYSIDEVFIDVTPYLKMYKCSAHELAMKMINAVLEQTGITATVGVGTNMYLAKIAMDILAKKMPPDINGVRIASLDEMSYRKYLWNHQPLTDFWMIGHGYSSRLNTFGMHTMGDVAQCSVDNEDLLYDIFGVNAELLIDHAWGWEPTTIKEIKKYKPASNSLSHGQVLHRPYKYNEARLVLREMSEQLSLDLVEKDLLTKKIVIHIGYDYTSLFNNSNSNSNSSTLSNNNSSYKGETILDYYGRKAPKYLRATINLPIWTSSAKIIMDCVTNIFDKKINRSFTVKRINVTAQNILNKKTLKKVKELEPKSYIQLDLFDSFNKEDIAKEKLNKELKRENEIQKVILDVKNKFGKNSILKGMNLIEGATAKDRNSQIGGHKA